MSAPETVNVYRGRFGRPGHVDPTRCRESVPDGGRSVGFHQCGNKAKVFRDAIVDGEEEKGVQSVGYCSIHDPVRVAEKRVAEQARWRREAEEREKASARRTQRPLDYRDALREIAAGHNDPRALAAEVLAKWSDQA